MSAPLAASPAAAPSDRLLVVDDEPDIVALVTFHLVKAGYRVSTATSATISGSSSTTSTR